MSGHAAGTDAERGRWRPSPFGLMLIATADFAGAVGLGNLLLGQGAVVWLLGAAALLLAGISTGG